VYSKKYDSNTHIWYEKKVRKDGAEVVVINKDDFDELSNNYVKNRNKLYHYNIIHNLANKGSRLIDVARILLAIILGIFTPIIITDNNNLSFDGFYVLLIVTLVFSLFIPTTEIDIERMLELLVKEQ
jgi:hypothetical protein